MPNKQFMMTLDQEIVDKAQKIANEKGVFENKTYTFQDILRERIDMSEKEINRYYVGSFSQPIPLTVLKGDEVLKGEGKNVMLINYRLLLQPDSSYSAILYTTLQHPDQACYAYRIILPEDLLAKSHFNKSMRFTHENAVQINMSGKTIDDTSVFETVKIFSTECRCVKFEWPQGIGQPYMFINFAHKKVLL